MEIIGQKWKLPILWYIADAEKQTLRYRELERKVFGIPPTVEYSLTEKGKTLIPALESVYQWADDQMKKCDPPEALTQSEIVTRH